MTVLSPSRRLVVTVVVAGILVIAPGAAALAAAQPAAGRAPTASSADSDGTGPQFYSGTSIDVSGEVNGDVYAAGQSVTISGDVTGDVIAAAQTITITGTVDGNVRLAGQDVTVSGDVSHSGTIFASTVDVTASGSLGDDLVGAAGDVAITGAIGRDVLASVRDLTIDGTVGGDVTYTSDTSASIADGKVSGTVERIAPSPSTTVEVSPWALFVGWLLGLLYALVALSIITVLAALLLPRLMDRVTNQLIPSPWRALLVGFVASMIMPFAVLVVLVTVIGAPLALAAVAVWVVLTLATFVYGAYYIGRLLFPGSHPPVVRALVGGLILIVALHIPWLNVAVWAAMVFFGLGAQLLAVYELRPWRRTAPVAGAVPSSEA